MDDGAVRAMLLQPTIHIALAAALLVKRRFELFKSSQVVGLRDRVAIIRTLIFSSPHPCLRGLWRGLVEVGR